MDFKNCIILLLCFSFIACGVFYILKILQGKINLLNVLREQCQKKLLLKTRILIIFLITFIGAVFFYRTNFANPVLQGGAVGSIFAFFLYLLIQEKER